MAAPVSDVELWWEDRDGGRVLMTRTSHGYVRPVPTWSELAEELADAADHVAEVVAGLRVLLPRSDAADQLLDDVDVFADTFVWVRCGILDHCEAPR